MANAPAQEAPKEEIEQYSAEDLALAQQEINNLTPAEYLSMSIRLSEETAKEIEALKSLPESGGLIFTEMVNKSGVVYHITARGTDLVSAINNMERGVRYAGSKYGWRGVIERPPAQSQPSDMPPSGVRQSAPQPGGLAVKGTEKLPLGQGTQTSQPAEPTYEDAGNQDRKGGTNILNKVMVTDGKIVFTIAGFQYPVPDARGPEIVAKLFDDEIGFSSMHFHNDGASYSPADWGGNLYVDWEEVEKYSRSKGKNVKYRNVVRVHR